MYEADRAMFKIKASVQNKSFEEKRALYQELANRLTREIAYIEDRQQISFAEVVKRE